MAFITSLPPEILGPLIFMVIESSPEMGAICASICKEWQAHVEQKTFASLRLDQNRVAASYKIITPARQAYVRHIEMNVLLPDWEIADGGRHPIRVESCWWPDPETRDEQDTNNKIFTDAISDIWWALASWQLPAPGEGERGISLQLHAFSPGDVIFLRDRANCYGRRNRKLRWKHSYPSLNDKLHGTLTALAAGRAALRMPKLKILSWSALVQCFLVYDVADAELYFGSTSALDMTDEVKDAWRATARIHMGRSKELTMLLEDLNE